MKLFAELSMDGYAAEVYVNARSRLSFKVSDMKILFTKRDEFSISTKGGFLSGLLTASGRKSMQVSTAQWLGDR